MTFVADPVEFRTYDLHRGLELFIDGVGSDGDMRYKLVRSDGITVHFSARWCLSRAKRWRQQNPSADRTVVHFVRSVRGRFPSRSRGVTDGIIREALVAYKGGHGLPADSGVAVFFD